MVQATLAHIQEHVQLWFSADPNVLSALGIQPAPVPPPPPPPPPPQPKPTIVGTAEAALTQIMNDISYEAKDRINAALGILKAPGGAMDVPPMPAAIPPMTSGKVGRPSHGPKLAGVLGAGEGPQHIAEARMPSMPKDPATGLPLGPTMNIAPPGVGPTPKA